MTRQKRTFVVMSLSVVLAAVASFAVYRVIQRLPAREVEVPSAQVVVAANPIPVGTLLEAKDLRTVPWPSRNPVEGAVTDPTMLVGRGVIVQIGTNEPVTLSKVADPAAGSGMAPLIPSGMRAISIRVNEVIGVAGFVTPGTRVDLLVTIDEGEGNRQPMSRTVVSNVQVLTAGSRYDQEKSRQDGKPIETSVVTLMVLPEDGEKIALAQNEGKLTLALRNPMDVAPTSTQGIRKAALMAGPGGQPVIDPVRNRVVARVKPAAPAVVAPAIYRVETIRAAKRGEEEVLR
ncbi:MAG: Flp pilus assembly protein CpaB [Vicinamibacterales bacterium]